MILNVTHFLLPINQPLRIQMLQKQPQYMLPLTELIIREYGKDASTVKVRSHLRTRDNGQPHKGGWHR